jgi:hypothetical protein
MTSLQWQFAIAVEELVGTPFRLHGRDRMTGLDCVGVVLAGLARIGCPATDVRGYGLRNLDHQPYLAQFRRSGFSKCAGSPDVGDVVQVSPGPGQLHLLVASANGGFVHAHAQLGRVVQSHASLPWPVQALWRLNAN